jgi:hypothetical protein
MLAPLAEGSLRSQILKTKNKKAWAKRYGQKTKKTKRSGKR